MGVIDDLNKRVDDLTKKQAEIKRALAVEEHKLAEVEAQLVAEGYDVTKMTQEEFDKLYEKLTDDIEAEQARISLVLDEAEALYRKFQALR